VIENGNHHEIVAPHNKRARKIFHEFTGVKLPAGKKATMDFLTARALPRVERRPSVSVRDLGWEGENALTFFLGQRRRDELLEGKGNVVPKVYLREALRAGERGAQLAGSKTMTPEERAPLLKKLRDLLGKKEEKGRATDKEIADYADTIARLFTFRGRDEATDYYRFALGRLNEAHKAKLKAAVAETMKGKEEYSDLPKDRLEAIQAFRARVKELGINTATDRFRAWLKAEAGNSAIGDLDTKKIKAVTAKLEEAPGHAPKNLKDWALDLYDRVKEIEREDTHHNTNRGFPVSSYGQTGLAPARDIGLSQRHGVLTVRLPGKKPRRLTPRQMDKIAKALGATRLSEIQPKKPKGPVLSWAERIRLAQPAANPDFKETFPFPDPKTLEALDKEGRSHPFSEAGDLNAQNRALHEETGQALRGAAQEWEHLTKSLADGVDPATGRKPKDEDAAKKLARRTQDAIDSTVREIEETIAAYEDVYGTENADAFRKAMLPPEMLEEAIADPNPPEVTEPERMSAPEAAKKIKAELETKGAIRIGNIDYSIQEATKTGGFYYRRVEDGIRQEKGGDPRKPWTREEAIDEAVGDAVFDMLAGPVEERPAAPAKPPAPKAPAPGISEDFRRALSKATKLKGVKVIPAARGAVYDPLIRTIHLGSDVPETPETKEKIIAAVRKAAPVGWKSVEVDVTLENGEVVQESAGHMADLLSRKIERAAALLNCVKK